MYTYFFLAVSWLAKFGYRAGYIYNGRIVGVTMTEVSLPWLLTKVTSSVVGTTKFHHFQRAVQSLDLKLTEDEVIWLEELYVTHVLTGVMAQNRPERAKEKRVWSTKPENLKSNRLENICTENVQEWRI